MEEVFSLLAFHSLGVALGAALFLFADALGRYQHPLHKALYGQTTNGAVRFYRLVIRVAGIVIATASMVWLIHNLMSL